MRFVPNMLWVLIGLTSCVGCQEKELEVYTPPTEEIIDIPAVDMILTLANATQKLSRQEGSVIAYDENLQVIEVEPGTNLQTIDGFGFALTGGSAKHLQSMSTSARSVLLNELFGPQGININFIRISLGSSDLDAEVFSYADTPDNTPDPDLSSFSITPDQVNLIPLIKEILAIQPNLKIMSSPWSPPVWMKSNKSSVGGTLLPEYYNSYSKYFIEYIKAMKSEGINIDFITIQNEPLHPGNNPSMYMTAGEQSAFIKGYLGPAFEEAQIAAKILVYDHNVDRPDYPLDILDDSSAKKYIYGSAFHLYRGQISALSTVHSKHPDRHIYFTEQWYGAPGNFAGDLNWHIREVVIGSIRNWSRGVIEWNLSSNPLLQPHTDGGCDQCLGAITLDGDQVKRNAGYYVIGHVSSFVPSGSQRINSTYLSELPNVAFITPENEIVLLVLNDTDQNIAFSVKSKSILYSANLDAGSVATFKWKND